MDAAARETMLSSSASDEPRFLTTRTIVEVGVSRLIPFRVAPADNDREFSAVAPDPSLLVIARPAAALAGSDTGFIRVRGAAPGRTRLSLGEQFVDIEVVPPRAPFDQRLRAQVVAPAPGTAAWGRVAVGVEWFEENPDSPSVCTLRAGDRALSPVSLSPAAQGPTRRAVFEIDTDSAQSPFLALTPVSTDSTGRESPGDPVILRIVHPRTAEVAAAEAEDTLHAPRPERFAKGKLAIRRDPGASGGAFVSNNGGEGPVCFPIDVPSLGWYQVAITAGADFGGGALPTVGVVVDKEKQPITNGRIVDEQWRRTTIGVPIRLPSGTHTLTLQYLNDFYAPKLDDRNLRIDRVEAARVADDSGELAAGVADAMQAMQPSTMQMAAMRSGAAGEPMNGAPAAGAATITDPLGLREAALRVAFLPPLGAASLSGETEITARCSYRNSETSPAPAVTLYVNNRAVGTQRSASPKFVLDTSWFNHGANSFSMKAAGPDGSLAATPTVELTWPGSDGNPGQARAFHRYTIHEPGWDDAARALIKKDREPPEQRTLAFYSEAAATLALPLSLAGDFDVLIEARGDQFKGPPIASVALETGAETTPIGEAKVTGGGWSALKAGEITLIAGAKRLRVAFTNDAYEEGKGDRNLFVQALVLRQRAVPRSEAAPAPHATIRYPSPGQSVAVQDALVAEAWSQGGALSSAELLFDNQPTGLKTDSVKRPGPIVLPLLLRGLAPGEHTVALRATDAAGSAADSDPVRINVLSAATDEPSRYERAVRLLDRLAFGPDPDELAAILTLGEDKWLDDRLSRSADDPEDLAAFESAVVMFPNRRAEGDVQQRALAHALNSPNPVRARFVLWTQNHFSTWIRKDEAPIKCDEHAAFWRLGVSPFPDLLLASATSPAMLRYLDQEHSYAGRLNENYAREIMELHTLGVHGGYTQVDVTNLASILTGLTLARQGDGHSPGEIQAYDFRFDPLLSEPRGTTVFGLALPDAAPAQRFDRARLALEMLASHPSTATFVATKLAAHYVDASPPDDLVSDLARIYMETNGDMRAMLKAMVAHPGFWSTPVRLAHPLDYAVRLGRVSGQPRPRAVQQYLQRSRFGLFDRPTPDGYPEIDSDYADSNAMLQRWRYARDLAQPLAALVPAPWRAQTKTPDADPGWAQRIVDCLAVRVTGRVLGETSNSAALDLLSAAAGSREERVREAASFIAETPEANLR
jgi:uncharacterized protein (DUF1800 family)